MTTMVLRQWQTRPMNWRNLALLVLALTFVLLAADECKQENCYDACPNSGTCQKCDAGGER